MDVILLMDLLAIHNSEVSELAVLFEAEIFIYFIYFIYTVYIYMNSAVNIQ